jgi:hypothetical protein
MNKRHFAPVIAGVVVFGAVTAFAAGFTVSSTTVVSGSTTVTGCNATAAVSYTTIWDTTLKAYKVNTAPVTTAAACHGMGYKVTLQNASNASIGEVTGTLDAVTGAASPDFSSLSVPASSVSAIAVTVTG